MSTNFVVEVQAGDVVRAISQLKTGLAKCGFFRELRRRASFTPPSLARRRKALKARQCKAKAWKRIALAADRYWGTEA